MEANLYRAAHEAALWRNMSHFGRFRVSGADAAALLHHLTTNDIKKLKPGRACDAVLVNSKARTLDILTIVRGESDFLVLTSPNRRAIFAPHAQKFVLFRQDITIEDVSEHGVLWGVFGAKAEERLRESGLDIPAENESVASSEIDGQRVGVLRTGRLPFAGFLLWSERGNLPASIEPVPLCDNETYNVLRVEAGVPVAGLEISEDVNPWEAGLDDMISLHKGCYNGQEVVARLHAYKKVKQGLMGLRLERPFAMGQRATLKADGKDAGFATSSVESPQFGVIGLAYVRGAWSEPGTVLEAVSGDETQQATVVSLPFATG